MSTVELGTNSTVELGTNTNVNANEVLANRALGYEPPARLSCAPRNTWE